MKKELKRILSLFVLIIVMVSGISVSAEETLQVEWYGDYESMELVINAVPFVNYIQQISVAMYDAEEANPSMDNYRRMGEIRVNPNEKGEIRFKISDALTANDGKYTVLFQGNGHKANQSRASENVWILTPSQIADGSGNGLLKDINNSDVSTVKSNIDKVSKALQIGVAANESTGKLNTFLNIRTTDFSTRFSNLEDVRNAWNVSAVIEYLNNGGQNTATLFGELSKCIEIVGVDETDEDYLAYKNDILTTIITDNSSINNETGAKNIADFKKVFKHAKAVAVINNTASDDMADAIAKYYQDVEISNETYTDYGTLSETDKEKVLRQVIQKDFKNANAVKKAFTDAVNELADNIPGNGGGDNGNSGGSSGGGGGGGGSATGNDYAITESPVQVVISSTSFSDCGSNHWASNYVNSLKENGVISGYPDGKFYPEKGVSREEFTKMAILVAGLYSENSTCDFADVSKEDWSYHYIATANQLEIINGLEEDRFGIGQGITRQDVAVIIYRILNYLNITGTNDKENIATQFKDTEKISDYAMEGINALSQMGVLNGFEDGTFKPQNNITRAETAKVLYVMKGFIQK